MRILSSTPARAARAGAPRASLKLASILLLLALPTGGSASAQAPAGGERTATRAELETLVRSLETFAATPENRARIARLSQRLNAGDFTPGERIYVRIDADSTLFSDTLTVRDSLILDIRGIRRLPIGGLLYSELEGRVQREIAAVVRDAQATAQPLMRVAVMGATSSPGFRSVPAETMLDRLLSLGGNPLPNAKMDKMRVMRGEEVLLNESQVRTAIVLGRTLGALGIEDGDALMVPPGGAPWDRSATLQIISLLMAPVLAIVLAR